MLKTFWAWVTGKKAVVGGGLAGSGALLIMFMAVSNEVESKIDKVDKRAREYIDLKLENVEQKINNLEDGQTDIKMMLNKIDNRLYQMRKSD